jgi:hypothetical protein
VTVAYIEAYPDTEDFDVELGGDAGREAAMEARTVYRIWALDEDRDELFCHTYTDRAEAQAKLRLMTSQHPYAHISDAL